VIILGIQRGGGEIPPEILNPPEIWQREKFGQLILMRIIEIVATRCDILTKAKNALNSILAGAPPQTPLGEFTALLHATSCI